jgi:hypothetical protein
LRPEVRRWCDYIKSVALSGLAVVRLGIGRSVECQLNLRDGMIGPSFNRLHPWPEVIDHVVPGNDVGDVFRLSNDLDISFGSLDVARVVRFPPVRKADERVGSRSNVIMRI